MLPCIFAKVNPWETTLWRSKQKLNVEIRVVEITAHGKRYKKLGKAIYGSNHSRGFNYGKRYNNIWIFVSCVVPQHVAHAQRNI